MRIYTREYTFLGLFVYSDALFFFPINSQGIFLDVFNHDYSHSAFSKLAVFGALWKKQPSANEINSL